MLKFLLFWLIMYEACPESKCTEALMARWIFLTCWLHCHVAWFLLSTMRPVRGQYYNRFWEKCQSNLPPSVKYAIVIRYLVWKEKTPVGVYNEVKTIYGDKAMNCTSVFKWCGEFKNGLTSVHDDQRSRPSIVTDKIVEKIENALHDNCRLTMDELSVMFPQIYRSMLHETITEILRYRKLLRGGSQKSWQTNTS